MPALHPPAGISRDESLGATNFEYDSRMPKRIIFYFQLCNMLRRSLPYSSTIPVRYADAIARFYNALIPGPADMVPWAATD